MGQAKRRGTYEERKESALHDIAAIRKILLDQEKTWWDSLSKDEQKEIILKRTEQLCALQTSK